MVEIELDITLFLKISKSILGVMRGAKGVIILYDGTFFSKGASSPTK